ncbi:MAG: hypothetical protein M3P23_11495 [Actinomycetota bacterium]|nr:hypothetical protein [Actinomycetota bacterium]
MPALFRKRAEGARPDAGRLEELTRNHLLLISPETTTPELVATLVRARVDDADLDLDGRAKVGRRSAIIGPVELTEEEAAQIGAPDGLRAAYLLEAPKERDPDGFEAFVDPLQMALWMRAFPGGPPFREEGDLVALGLDLARRLRGVVRVAGYGVLITPDPTRNVELTVWSPYWVESADLVDLVAPVLPGARVDLGRPHDEPPRNPGVPWAVDPLDPMAEELENALTPELLERLEDVAEATDAWAQQEMDLTDGYAVVGDGGIVIGVQVETGVPGWVLRQLADLPDVPSDRLVTYDIRWWPDDVGQLHLETANAAHRIARSIVGETIRSVARVTSEAVFGVVVDAAGFHVPPEQLR